MTVERTAGVLADRYRIEQIKLAIAGSPSFTPAIFKLDPMWDPLRKNPDFKKLVEVQ